MTAGARARPRARWSQRAHMLGAGARLTFGGDARRRAPGRVPSSGVSHLSFRSGSADHLQQRRADDDEEEEAEEDGADGELARAAIGSWIRNETALGHVAIHLVDAVDAALLSS